MSRGLPVRVATIGEGDRRPPREVRNSLRVLVDGQYAGAVYRVVGGEGWATLSYGRMRAEGVKPWRETTHPTADAAVRAVVRSPFARQLGARADSPVHFSPRAQRVTNR